MRSKSFRIVLNIAVIISMLLPNVTAFAAHARPPERASAAQPRPAPESGLFRTRVQVDAPARWQRLESLGVVILQRNEDSALVLVDDQQLEALARLRFQPRGSDELGALAAAQGKERAWLRAGLQPLLRQGAALQAQARAAKVGAGVDADALTAARADLRAAMRALTPEQRAGIASSISPDDDGDGLTNTEESWWCTDPQMADTDSDGISDGDEIGMLKDWMANRRAGPPGGTPWPSWPFNSTTCPDKDHDSIPNLAERWELGLNMDWESTDHDKFDDGQELFGVTNCPGGDNNCGYGDLPRSSDAGYVGSTMPGWVKAPGNHPLVAAFPVPEIDVVESSFHVETVTTVTTDHTIGSGTEKSYSTAKTEGTSTSEADTETWNNWQEVATTTPQNTALQLGVLTPLSGAKELGFESDTDAMMSIAECQYDIRGIGRWKKLILKSDPLGRPFGLYGCIKVIKGGLAAIGKIFRPTPVYAPTIENPDDPPIEENQRNNQCMQTSSGPMCPAAGYEYQPTKINKTFPAVRNPTDRNAGGQGTGYKIEQNTISSTSVMQWHAPLFYPVPTKTIISGGSRGGSRTHTHTKYEEHTVTEGHKFSSSESWGNATAVDSSHAADLWFSYKVHNKGTEYAREICNLAFSIYIGDDSNPAYTYFVANDLGGDGCFHNFMPGEEHDYSSHTGTHAVPLTLEQMKAIDLGGTLRVEVEDFTYGTDDESFYQNALNVDMRIDIEDGKVDGDEAIDTFLIPTWGEETVMDVLARYFPHDVDEDGNLIAIWTPEYNRTDTPAWCVEPQAVGIGAHRTLWCKHALSTADWWNIYTDGMGDGSEGFQDTPASGGATALFRFNKDSDLDGYSDRSEAKLGTDPNDPADYPRPELIAGVHSIQAGNHVTATLSLLNTGLYDAYGVEAVMIAPNDTISITNNTVGGSGRVRTQKQVIVGSRMLLQSPLPDAWTQDGHAQPAVGGYYTGQQDRTYTFTVACGDGGGCEVGAGTWTLDWDDGDGHSGSLDFGDGYASPTLLAVGAFGLKLGLLSGHVDNGDSFTVEARTPRDTFQYEIASGHESDYSPPLVLVSYNDPQGNHRFLIPASAMNLAQPTDNLAPLGGTMLPDVGVEIVTSQAAQAGANSTDLVITNPGDVTLSDAHLFLEFVNITGTVVSEVPVTVTVEPGPNVVSIDWDTADFDPAYQPDEDYIVMAFWTDYQGNILDTAARPLSSFQDDPRPALAMDAADETWDFGTARQGTLLQHRFTVGSVGYQDLQAALVGRGGVWTRTIDSRSAAWIDTGITVQAGERVGIWGGGVACYGSNGTALCYDPDGRGRTAPGDWTAPGLTELSLVGKIGDGAPFQVGKFNAVTADRTGRLYLVANDRLGTYGDNGGSYKARIEVYGLPQDDAPQLSLAPADVHAIDLTLRTESLPVGPFTRTLTLRTSDPANPTKTITIQGEITPKPCDGFLGEYFDNQTLSGQPALTRCDDLIDFHWGTGSPDGSIPADHFSARWTKTFTVSTAGNYTFETRSDDGVRVYVDNQLVINDWESQSFYFASGEKYLDVGDHVLRVEWYENAGKADVRLVYGPEGMHMQPLDYAAAISGNHNKGEWVTFTHDIDPSHAQTLHPVKVYRQDYGVLYGVGKYATDFSAGTASYDMFGDGGDGDLTVNSGQTKYIDNTKTIATASVAAGHNSIPVYSTSGFHVGDEVLIIQSQGPNTGYYEYRTIAGIGNKVITLSSNLSHSYTVSKVTLYQHPNYGGRAEDFWNEDSCLTNNYIGNDTASSIKVSPGTKVVLNEHCDYKGAHTFFTQNDPNLSDNPIGDNRASSIRIINGGKVQLLRVAHYRNINVNGTLKAHAWNGGTGGIIVARVSGSLSINGTVDVSGGNGQTASNDYPQGGSGGGYRGGQGDAVNNDNYGEGYQGEGTVGFGHWTASANGNGGGAGAGSPQTGNFGTGGGGGNGTRGATSGAGGRGEGGYTSGNAALTLITFGGGGGGSNDNPNNSIGGGGGGGGIVMFNAKSVHISGHIKVNGGNGGGSKWGAGGGAGGSVLIRGESLNVGSGRIQATGGSPGRYGGAGGNGRIRLEYCESLSGSTNPGASTQKLNCYIAEQVESAPYTTTRLNLPESFTGGRTYAIQYGRRMVFGGAGNQTSTLRLPAAPFASATLDALISGVGSGNVTFKLDIGNNGHWDWETTQNVSGSATLHSPNLAAAFTAWWAANGHALIGSVDVPVKVYLSKGGQTLLTNLQVVPTGSRLRHVRLTAQNYATLTLDMTVGGGSGDLTVAADVGDDGSVDWTWSGSPAYPAHITTDNLATAFNAWLAGRSGLVDAPVRFYLTPMNPLGLDGVTATPAGQADVAPATPQTSPSTPTEGDAVTVSAAINNNGALDSGPLTASFFATPPGGNAWYIGSAFVPNVPANGSAQASIQWDTLGFTGDTPVRVVVDPYDRVAETDETNNVVTATLTILTRPDLAIPAIGLSDEEPMAGETVTVTLPISNSGQTAAASAVTALSVQAPDGSTSTLCEPSLAVGAGAQASATCAWTPAAPGRYRLLAQADRDNGVDESNEGNNQRWRDVYVGLASPILLDSGGDSDAAYDSATGYGYLNGQANTFCGAEPEHSQRTNASGPVKYRFDHLLPGHFYHLDVTLYECDGVGRQEKIWVDDNPVSDMVDLADHNVHALSFLLDPAFYADRSIEVSIEELLGNDVVVAGVNLYDVDYRYADAGGGDDLPYDAMRGYGWVDGVAQTNWGTLPYRSRRIDLGDSDPSDDPDNQLVYRFDALDPDKRYQVHFVFYQASGSAVHQEIGIDGYNTGATVDLNGEQRVDLTVDVPPGAYSADGTIQVYINRTDASTSAFVNEIALEELTIGPNETNMITQVKSLHPTSPNWVSFFVKPPVQGPNECSGVTQTSAFTSVAGEALLAGANAPLDSVVEAYSASGDKVGCFQVSTPGLYGYMRIYGNPGMSDGEPVFFKINGIPAQSDPPYFIWHDDKGVHTLNLDAPDLIPVETMTQSIWDHFSRLQCQNGTYLPPPADQRYNTCHTVTPGRGYLLYTDAAADWSLTGVPLAEDAPLPLEAGWNWLGYLPQCELSVETALASISGQYDLIHSEAGTYLPPPADPAFNNFNTLAPTLGYMIHTTAAVTLTYPVGQCGQLLHTQVQPAASEDCAAVATGQFSSYYGYAMKGEEPFPPGASIRVLSPRGEVVGCGQVQQDGLFPYLRVYGQDGDLPGMVYGETPAFFIDGRPVLPEPAVVWMPDMSVHQVQLNPPPGQLYLPMLTAP